MRWVSEEDESRPARFSLGAIHRLAILPAETLRAVCSIRIELPSGPSLMVRGRYGLAMPRRMTRTLRLPIFIHASPSRVFKWISTADRLTRWLADSAALSGHKGGSYSLAWDGGPTHTGRVLEFSRGVGYTLTWQWPGKEQLGMTKLRLSIERKGDGTVLRFIHSGFQTSGEWLELYEGAIRGWTYFMMNLKSVLETEHDLRSPDDW
jgi:uncharacterized protein YndB with AHSA1/START domain